MSRDALVIFDLPIFDCFHDLRLFCFVIFIEITLVAIFAAIFAAILRRRLLAELRQWLEPLA